MTATVATLMVLVLYINDVPKEFMGHHEDKGQWVEMGLSGCLQIKRTLKRNGWKDSYTGETRYACEKHKVEVGKNHEGLEVVKKLLSDGKKSSAVKL